jgi:hypothetical protein
MTLDQLVYPKPMRFHSLKNPTGKKPMSREDEAFLLKAKVAVEEKMDGAPVKFVTSSPSLAVFAEDLRRRHTIDYHIPGRYAVFDIFDAKRGVFVYHEEKLALSMELRKGKIKVIGTDGNAFFPVPMICSGKFTLDELALFLGLSAYAFERGNPAMPAPGEGIVVKPFSDCFPEEFVAGKIVRSEFTGSITENYLRLPYHANMIDPSHPVIPGPLVAAAPGHKVH